MRHSCHDPEDWPCEGPPWLWPTDGADCDEPDDEESDDEDPEESEPFDEESLPFDEPDDDEPDDEVPDDEVPDDEVPDDDPVEPEEPEVVDPVACVPEKSTAEVIPAAARLDNPMIDVTLTAVRLPAERESMCPHLRCRAIGSVR